MKGISLTTKSFCLCGSTKYKKEFEQVNLWLTLQGYVVITVSSFGHADKFVWTDEQKELLDRVHKLKIDMSDAVFVIDVDKYIGQSTISEIDHALQKGKTVYYLSGYESEFKKFVRQTYNLLTVPPASITEKTEA